MTCLHELKFIKIVVKLCVEQCNERSCSLHTIQSKMSDNICKSVKMRRHLNLDLYNNHQSWFTNDNTDVGELLIEDLFKMTYTG